jgi:hypothetical protein
MFQAIQQKKASNKFCCEHVFKSVGRDSFKSGFATTSTEQTAKEIVDSAALHWI